MSKSVPFVFITDNGYALPTSVAICSLVKSTINVSKLCIKIIYTELSEDNKRRLCESGLDCTDIELIHFDAKDYAKYKNEALYVTPTSLIKFELANIFENFDKIIYLDGDIIVRKDLTELQTLNLGDSYCAAVQDMDSGVQFKGSERLGLPYYFNSGVMVLNLKKIRFERLSYRMFQIKKERKDLYYMDQDVLNVAFGGKIILLPLRFNYINESFVGGKYSIQEINDFFQSNYNDIQDISSDSCILHMAGQLKPWKHKEAPSYEEWIQYFHHSSMKDENIEYTENKDHNKFISLLKTKLETLLHKNSYVNSEGSWETQYSFFRIPLIAKIRSKNGVAFRILGCMFKTR